MRLSSASDSIPTRYNFRYQHPRPEWLEEKTLSSGNATGRPKASLDVYAFVEAFRHFTGQFIRTIQVKCQDGTYAAGAGPDQRLGTEFTWHNLIYEASWPKFVLNADSSLKQKTWIANSKRQRCLAPILWCFIAKFGLLRVAWKVWEFSRRCHHR